MFTPKQVAVQTSVSCRFLLFSYPSLIILKGDYNTFKSFSLKKFLVTFFRFVNYRKFMQKIIPSFDEHLLPACYVPGGVVTKTQSLISRSLTSQEGR